MLLIAAFTVLASFSTKVAAFASWRPLSKHRADKCDNGDPPSLEARREVLFGLLEADPRFSPGFHQFFDSLQLLGG